MNSSYRCFKTTVLLLCSLPLSVGGCECGGNKLAGRTEAPTPTAKPSQPERSKEPLIKKAEIVDWCPEHGVPESICTRCNASLIAEFKKKGDWCSRHGLPESQCFDCHPDLKTKFEAMAPKKDKP
ncbi:MAG: hypothetical protein L6Q92_16240 [Phycisphaerae bacterium]|nr:hypothetical protein [Phycisphaerae bacterium]MCK6497969.1 hypothetical protein [Nitrospira sp.]